MPADAWELAYKREPLSCPRTYCQPQGKVCHAERALIIFQAEPVPMLS